VTSFDWSRTSLGAYAQWPERLKGYVSMIIEMPTPAIIFWGPDQVQIYNDGYSVIMGPRHPTYFGATYKECWPDTYPVIHPWMLRVLAGEVVEVEKQLFVLTRYGFTEEAYFTFTFSPLRDDTGAIAGVFQPVVEVTQDVIGERRAQTLRSLPQPGATLTGVRDVIESLAHNPKCIAFSIFYEVDETGALRLGPYSGISSAPDEPPAIVSQVLGAGEGEEVDIKHVLGSATHTSTWGDPTLAVFVAPVRRNAVDRPRGVVVFGLSPRLNFDDRYRGFLETIVRELASHIDTERARTDAQALQRRAEAARSEAEIERKRLHTVFERAPVAIGIMSGPDYVIDMINPLMAQLWGHTPEAMRGKPLFDAMPELVGQGLRELLDNVRATGTAFVGTEFAVNLRGEQKFFNFVYEPMHDAVGNVISVFAVAIDVTPHVLGRYAAQEASRAKDEFLAMLGHELRNPLAPIFTALELMRMRGETASSREREVIERQAKHLGVLVEDLLDISRITTGKVELKRSRTEIEPIISKAIETASPLFDTRRHDVRVNVANGLLVDADPARMTQVFANLLTNAAKYTDPGGRISVVAQREGDQIAVSVTDNGRGMAPEMLPRVFDLFVQERQTIDRSLGGLGIGLAIVKNLVTMHGGTVEAKSPGLGHGSSFVVRLPAAPTNADAVAPKRKREMMPAKDRAARVLIVDDNEDAAALLADILGEIGYDCTVAYDGPRALEIAKHASFDSVLLDIGLPAMDGYEVARHLREMPGGSAVKLVAITGYGQYDDKQRSLDAGFDHHLVKPVDISQLTGLLQA
jgi:PAS domain S-box-containing protein